MILRRSRFGSARFPAALTALFLSVVLLPLPPANAASLTVDRAKRAIARKAYRVNGTFAFEFGARPCRRLASNEVSCRAYVKKVRNGRRQVCTDRMRAVRRSGRVLVRGAAPPGEWRCRRL